MSRSIFLTASGDPVIGFSWYQTLFQIIEQLKLVTYIIVALNQTVSFDIVLFTNATEKKEEKQEFVKNLSCHCQNVCYAIYSEIL